MAADEGEQAQQVGGPPRDPWIGRTFAGRYRVERRLGQGGMGIVYAARQLTMDRLVALKVLASELGAAPSSRARFKREMKAASLVEHAHTVRVYDFGEDDDGHLFLAMELLDGRTLQLELQTRGALDLHRLLAIGEAIARALAAAHAEGVVHRDLKPENVMLLDRYGERDEVKVLDFGIARLLDAEGEAEGEAVTRTGSLLGTPLYMSPEAALGQKVDARADLYALGLVLYQMATGQLPFRDAQPLRLLYRHANESPLPPSTLAPGRVPPALEALILACLEKAPEARPADATAIAKALRSISEQTTLHDGGETGLAGASRLADSPAAMAAARALRADPQRAVATLRAPAGHFGGAGAGHGGEPGDVDVTAPTWAGAHDALTGAPTGLLVTPDADAAADAAAMTAATLADGAASVAAGHPQALAAATPDATAKPADLTGSAARAGAAAPDRAPDQAILEAPVAAPAISASYRSPAALAGIALAIGLAVGVAVVVARWAGEGATPPAAAAAPQPTAAVAAASSPPTAPVFDRAGLDGALRAAGLPATATPCAPPGADEAMQMGRAATLLRGGAAQSKRPADAEAAALLTTAQSADGIALHAYAMLAAGRGHAHVIQRVDAASRACAQQPLAERLRGQIHLQGGRWEPAEAALRRAVALAADDAAGWHLLGVAALGQRHPLPARAAFERALALRPDHLEARLGLGRACFAMGDLQTARGALQTAAAAAPHRADIAFLRGGLEEAAGDAVAARAAFCAAARLGHAAAARRCPAAPADPALAPAQGGG